MAITITQKVDEILDQLDNLDSLCDLFFGKKVRSIYKSIAVSLRILLTGSSGDQGLFSDVAPSGTLPPLRVKPDHTAPPDHFWLPTEVTIVRGGKTTLGAGCKVRDLHVAGGAVEAMTIGMMLDAFRPHLAIVDWLAQPFLRENWTLQQFISSVASKDGGAHLNPNEKILAMNAWGYFHWHAIPTLTREIIPSIRTQLWAAFPGHARAVR